MDQRPVFGSRRLNRIFFCLFTNLFIAGCGLYSKYLTMKTWIILLLLPLGFFSCHQAENGDPEILEGHYITNPVLDVRCVALPANQLPSLEVIRNTGNTYDFILHQYFPEKTVKEFRRILLEPVDQGFGLRYENQEAGTWKNVEFLDNRKILTLSLMDGGEFVYFVGEKK